MKTEGQAGVAKVREGGGGRSINYLVSKILECGLLYGLAGYKLNYVPRWWGE